MTGVSLTRFPKRLKDRSTSLSQTTCPALSYFSLLSWWIISVVSSISMIIIRIIHLHQLFCSTYFTPCSNNFANCKLQLIQVYLKHSVSSCPATRINRSNMGRGNRGGGVLSNYHKLLSKKLKINVELFNLDTGDAVLPSTLLLEWNPAAKKVIFRNLFHPSPSPLCRFISA